MKQKQQSSNQHLPLPPHTNTTLRFACLPPARSRELPPALQHAHWLIKVARWLIEVQKYQFKYTSSGMWARIFACFSQVQSSSSIYMIGDERKLYSLAGISRDVMSPHVNVTAGRGKRWQQRRPWCRRGRWRSGEAAGTAEEQRQGPLLFVSLVSVTHTICCVFIRPRLVSKRFFKKILFI